MPSFFYCPFANRKNASAWQPCGGCQTKGWLPGARELERRKERPERRVGCIPGLLDKKELCHGLTRSDVAMRGKKGKASSPFLKADVPSNFYLCLIEVLTQPISYRCISQRVEGRRCLMARHKCHVWHFVLASHILRTTLDS